MRACVTRLLTLTGLLAVSACTVVAGLGTAAVLGTTAAVVASCHDHVEITVVDGALGSKTCQARVSATQDDSEVEFSSCYHAPLGSGAWLIRAELPGYAAATSNLVVDDRSRCDGSVQTVLLRLDPVGQPGMPPQPMAPPPAPVLVPAPSAPAGPAAPPPTASPTAPAAPTAPVPTAPGPAQPVQRFPDVAVDAGADAQR